MHVAISPFQIKITLNSTPCEESKQGNAFDDKFLSCYVTLCSVNIHCRRFSSIYVFHKFHTLY